MPTVGIVGAGPMSRSLAELLCRQYRVTVGTRHRELLKVLGLSGDVKVTSLQEAAESDVVLLAVRHRVAPGLLTLVGRQLSGKVVIDTMNGWAMPKSLTEGCWLANRLPTAKVVRAFTHIDHEALLRHGTTEPGRWAAGYAADDREARIVAEQLITATGFVPVQVGGLAQSAPLDVGGILWPYMFTPEDMRAALGHATPD